MNMKTNQKILIGIGILVLVVLIGGWWVWSGQKQVPMEEFCTANVLEECDGKKVSLVGVVNAEPAGKSYGYEMSDGVEWNEKLINRVIIDAQEHKIDIPIGKKIKVVGIVYASREADCNDGSQHLKGPEDKCFDPTVVIVESIEELNEGVIAVNNNSLEIGITTNKTQYDLGEDIVISITVKNDNENQVTENLTTKVTGMAAGGLVDYGFKDVREITILPRSIITETYNLTQETHVHNRHYNVTSYTSNSRGSINFDVLGGLDLKVIMPEVVLINKKFKVTLVVKNIVDIPVENIEISAEFGYNVNIEGAPIDFTIPTLAPSATNITTWVVSMPDDGYQSMAFCAQSKRGDYEIVHTGPEVAENWIELWKLKLFLILDRISNYFKHFFD